MRITADNVKVLIGVQHDHETTVDFYHKPFAKSGWVVMSGQQRVKFCKQQLRWRIEVKFAGDVGVDDEGGYAKFHEVEVVTDTRCDYIEMAGVLRQIFDVASKEFGVIVRIDANITVY